MNKTVAFIVLGSLVGIGIVGSVVLHVLRPETVAAFLPNLITLFGLMVTAAGTLYGLGKTAEKIDTVVKQTNGNLSRRDEKIDEQNREIARLNRLLHPDTVDIEGPDHRA